MNDLFGCDSTGGACGGGLGQNMVPGAAAQAVAAGTNCPNGWSGTAPDGSAQGKEALYGDAPWGNGVTFPGPGCFELARSSQPGGTDGATHVPFAAEAPQWQYVAYGLDAVSVLVGSDATAGAGGGGLVPGTPAQLTLREVAGIYDCTYSNWDQVQVGVRPDGSPVMGADAPIVRYWPQPGSGTAELFQDMLSSLTTNNATSTSFDPTTYTTADGCANDLTGNYVTQEGTEDRIVADGDQAGAIYVYSVGQFVRQWDDTSTYLTRSKNFDPSLTIASLGDLGAIASGVYTYADDNGNVDHPFDPYVDWYFNKNVGRQLLRGKAEVAEAHMNTAIVAQANEWYTHYLTNASGTATPCLVPGVRYIYNVIDPGSASYDAVDALVGSLSPLCQDTKIGSATQAPDQVIARDGFVPLPVQGPTGSHCVVVTPGS
jgi:hypothetical protein